MVLTGKYFPVVEGDPLLVAMGPLKYFLLFSSSDISLTKEIVEKLGFAVPDFTAIELIDPKIIDGLMFMAVRIMVDPILSENILSWKELTPEKRLVERSWHF